MLIFKIMFLAMAGSFFGHYAGTYLAGFAEMYYGERLTSPVGFWLSFIIRWGVFALCLIGAVAIAIE